MSSLGIVCSPLGDDGSDRFVCPGCLLSKRGLTEPSCWIGVAFVAVFSVSPECAFGLPMSRNCSRFFARYAIALLLLLCTNQKQHDACLNLN